VDSPKGSTGHESRRENNAGSHQHFHIKQGNWIRVDRGIYRLKRFPATAHEDLIQWWLWSQKKGVISHETAAALYDLGDLLPAKVHMTVPVSFRKKPPKGLVLHKANISTAEINGRDGVPATKPLRTILDLARAHLDDERLSAVTRDALQRGLVRRKELMEELVKAPKVTLQLAIRDVSEILRTTFNRA
jgi:hypothetical protein